MRHLTHACRTRAPRRLRAGGAPFSSDKRKGLSARAARERAPPAPPATTRSRIGAPRRARTPPPRAARAWEASETPPAAHTLASETARAVAPYSRVVYLMPKSGDTQFRVYCVDSLVLLERLVAKIPLDQTDLDCGLAPAPAPATCAHFKQSNKK